MALSATLPRSHLREEICNADQASFTSSVAGNSREESRSLAEAIAAMDSDIAVIEDRKSDVFTKRTRSMR